MLKKNPYAFFFRGLKDLKEEISKLRLTLPLEDDLKNNLFKFKEKISLDGKEIPNRFCIHPMEGCDGEPDGSPGELTFRRYKRFAKGGAGLIWVEGTAITPEGKANPRQLYINKSSAPEFKNLVESIRENALNYEGKKQASFIVLQLTHSGRYSKPEGKPAPLVFHHSPFLDPAYKLGKNYPLITDGYLDKLQDKYVTAAKIACSSGFDAVDIKACHGYLIDEIFSSHTRKDSKYGGSFENRIKFFTEVIEKIKKEIPGLIVTTRMNVYDAIPYPYGWGMKKDKSRKPDLKEPIVLIEKIKKMGVSMINVCFGNPYYEPHIERPYDYPIQGLDIPEEHPLKTIERNVKLTAQIKKVAQGDCRRGDWRGDGYIFSDLIVVATGFSWLRELFPHLGLAMLKNSSCDVIGLGRGALANPDFVNELLSTGKLKQEKTCITCSSCTQIMRDEGKAGCVIRDSEVYGPIYMEGRLKNTDYIKEIAKICKGCWGASCMGGCPAGMDVPAFINTFSNGETRDAYKIMKKDNILPETCAYTCPVEVLCERGCTSGIIGREAVPVHEIQKFIARTAREKGWTRIIPGKPNKKRVAVIGFGPAGIACSVCLIEKGCKVCVFEVSDKIGGMVTTVIPFERLPEGILEEEVKSFRLEETGLLEIRYNREICDKFTLDDIFKKGFDAVFISAGLSENTGLDTPEKPEGVFPALDFLREIKKGKKEGDSHYSTPRRNVGAVNSDSPQAAVIGGGNTAMDVAASLKKSGIRDVYLIYRRSFKELPAWPAEVKNALELGVHFLILNQPVGYLKNQSGKLSGIKIVRTELGEIDSSGRPSPVNIPDSEYVFPVSLCVEAIGQKISSNLINGLQGIEFEKGRIKIINGRFSTTREKVFAGGDIINGGKTVVQAVKEGMDAAKEIMNFL